MKRDKNGTPIFYKQNGFPTRYGYACGYGKEEWLNDKRRKTIFEDDSHNCMDVKWTDENSVGHWEQFFYWDGPGAAKNAEKLYNSIR